MDKAAIAALANAIQILNLIGKSGDPAGITSLFAWMARLEQYVDQVEGYTDTVEGLIGTANPATGDLTTVFKGLKLITDYVDTLETKLGLNTDPAGTNTVFARLAQMAGYTDTLETNLAAGFIRSIQRGTSAGAGNVTITAVNTAKTMVLSASKGSAGYVAARGSVSLTPSGGNILGYAEDGSGQSSGGFPTYSGSITGGSTDLTVKVYSAKLLNSTTIYCDGACEWQVIEYV
ncbi:hypothetical protein ACOBQJ_02490 [Pelotomaculum propionicicum]|uniref:hypothetical protein n=1 Tax=Pelotomaculum propionicicum TaxID=258475 RepID=UPI003B81425B